MRALVFGLFVVAASSVGCGHVLQSHDYPPAEDDSEYVSHGALADQEYMTSVCPNGYYIDSDHQEYAGTELKTVVVPTFHRHHLGAYAYQYEAPRIEDRKSFHCAAPYVPAGQEEKIRRDVAERGVAPGAFGAPVPAQR